MPMSRQGFERSAREFNEWADKLRADLDLYEAKYGAPSPAPFCTCPCSCDETPHDGSKCRLHDTVTDWEDVEQLTNIRCPKPHDAASLTERLIQAAVDYETGRCSRRELSEARSAVEAAMGPSR